MSFKRKISEFLDNADYLYPDTLGPVYADFSAIFWAEFKKQFIRKELDTPLSLVTEDSDSYFEAEICFNKAYFWNNVKPQFFLLKNGDHIAIQIKEDYFRIVAPVVNGKHEDG